MNKIRLFSLMPFFLHYQPISVEFLDANDNYPAVVIPWCQNLHEYNCTGSFEVNLKGA
jgi:hypothetical protein